MAAFSYLTPLPLNGGYRPPTTGQYLGFNPLNGGATPAAQNARDWASMPLTNDMFNSIEGMRRLKLSHDAQQRANALQSQMDNQLLSSATDDELRQARSGPPRTEREARLQRVLQDDYNARERGASMIPGPLQNLKLAQLQADLKHSQLQNYLDPLKFGLQQQAASLDKGRFGLDQQRMGLSEDQFRNQVINEDNQNIMGQDRIRLEQQSKDKEATQAANASFMQIQKAVADGQISADDAISAVPTLTPGQQAVLRGHEAAAAQAAAIAATQAQGFNKRLSDAMPQGVAMVPHKLNFNPLAGFGITSGSPAIPPSDAQIQGARDQVIQQFDKNATARKQIMFDPDTGQFVPIIRPPARSPFVSPLDNSVFDARGATSDGPAYNDVQQQPIYSPAPAATAQSQGGGNSLFEGRDGYLYRMVNGQLQKTTLRRR